MYLCFEKINYSMICDGVDGQYGSKEENLKSGHGNKKASEEIYIATMLCQETYKQRITVNCIGPSPITSLDWPLKSCRKASVVILPSETCKSTGKLELFL